jgi:hypothetical protein
MRPLGPLAFLAALLLTAASYGQSLTASKEFPSAPDKAVGVVIAEKAGGWLVFASPSMLPIAAEPINQGAGIVWEGPAGAYLVLYFPPDQKFPQPQVTVKTLGAVAPVDPPKPEDVPIPPQQTTGPVAVVIIGDASDLTVDEAEVLSKLRTWSDSRQADVTHLEFSPAADDARVKAYVAKIPAGKPLPWVFISRAKADGNGAVLLWNGPLAKTAAEIEAKVAEVTK